MDHIISRTYGDGTFQRRVLAATGLTWSGDACELTVMAFLIPSLKAEWGIEQSQADSIASVVFVGMLVGSLAWGVFSDYYVR